MIINTGYEFVDAGRCDECVAALHNLATRARAFEYVPAQQRIPA